MAIYKPSNLDPDLKELDILSEDGNVFSCQVNTSGSSVKAYKNSFLSENGEILFQGNTKNLTKSIQNKQILSTHIRYDNIENKIYQNNDEGKELEDNKVLLNGKSYLWNTRLYENNAPRITGQKPSTLVCSGFLTGTTTYVIWTDNSDKIEEGMYVEFDIPAMSDEDGWGRKSDYMFPILPPNIENKTLPKDDEEYRERKQISFVIRDLGWDKNFTKIELEDKLEYNYKTDVHFLLYQCSDKHGLKNFFADPNDNIALGNYVEIWNGTMSQKLEDKRKIVGYSNDTGEIRVQEPFSTIPTNGLTYKLFEYDLMDKEYKEKTFTVSNRIGGAPIYKDYDDSEVGIEFKVITNQWDENSKHLFIQPNINIKTDDTNPNQMIFDLGGQTININKKLSTIGEYVPDKISDITFNKLDNSQWLLECTNESTTDIFEDIDITPKNTYKVYTDFMDSMPNALFYSRSLPEISLKVRDIHGASITSAYTTYNQNISDAFALMTENDQIVFDIYDGDVNLGRYRLSQYQKSYDIGVVYFTEEINLDIDGKYTYQAFIVQEQTETPIIIPEDENTLTFYEFLVSVDEDVPSAKEVVCRNVEFSGEWFQQEGVLIKYYNYTLYYINGYNEAQEIGSSGDLYEIELKWVFRALETQKNYRVKLKIVDQYNREYIIEKDFFVNYTVEKSRFSSTYNLNCNETAIQVSIAVPSYVASIPTETQESVTSADILTTTEESYVSTKNDKVLNYSDVVGSLVGEKLEIPEVFSYFTQFAFPHGKSGVTTNFFEDISGEEEKIITSVAHQHPNKFFIDKNFESFWREIFPIILFDEDSSPSEVYLSILQDGVEVAREKVINNGCDENTGLVEIANKVILQSYVNLTYKAYLLVDDLYTLIQLDEGCSDSCLIFNDVFNIKIGRIDKLLGESQENPNFLKLRVYKNDDVEPLPCFENGNTYYDLYNNISLLKENIIYAEEQEFALQREYKENTGNGYRIIDTLEQLTNILTNLSTDAYKIGDKFLITSDITYDNQIYLAGPYICINSNSSTSTTIVKILQYNYATNYLFNDPVINYEDLKVDTYLRVNKDDTGGNVYFKHDDGEGTNFLWIEESASIKSYNESVLGRLRFNLILIVDIITVNGQEQEKVVCGLKWEVV